jgi:iron complex outermembrane receptor protein
LKRLYACPFFLLYLLAIPSSHSQEWKVNHENPLEARSHLPLELAFSIEPRSGFKAVFLYYRTDRQAKFQGRTLLPDEKEKFRIKIEPQELSGSELYYFLAVQDFSGNIHSILGSLQSPLRIKLIAQKEAEAGGEKTLDQEMSELELEFKLLELQQQEVVVTAGKRAQRITEAPAPVYIFTRDDLEMYGVRRITDLLRFAPAMRVQKVNEGTTLVGSRGFASESNNLILFLVGGQEKNQEIFGSPLYEAEPLLMHEVERIEIVRGPGSVLYGANAFSGVIQVITRRPEGFAHSTFLHYDHDLFFRSQSGQFFSRGVTQNAGYLLSGQWVEEGSDSSKGDKALKKLGTHGKLTLDDPVPLEVDLSALRFSGELFSVLGETPELTDHYSLSLRTSFGKSRLRLSAIHWDAILGIRDPILNPLLPMFHWRSDTLDGEFQLSFEIPEVNVFTLGFQSRYNTFGSPELVTPSVEEGRVGIYLQDELKPLEFLLINAGVRSDFSTLYLKDAPFRDRLTLSPRLAFIVPFSDEQSLRVGVGRAFRKPTFFETLMAFKALAPLDLNPQNPNLKNEEVTGLDLGYIAKVFGIRVNLDLFYNQYQRFIEFDPGLVRYINVAGKTLSFGGELSLRWDSQDGRISSFVNYSYLRIQREETTFEGFRTVTRFVDLNRDPQHMINAGFRYKTPWRMKFSLLAHWQSAHLMRIVNPEKGSLLFAVSENQEIKPYLNLFARLAYEVGPIEIGILGEHLESDRHIEFPTLTLSSIPDRLFPEPTGVVYGGERIAPRIFLYVEGRW